MIDTIKDVAVTSMQDIQTIIQSLMVAVSTILALWQRHMHKKGRKQ